MNPHPLLSVASYRLGECLPTGPRAQHLSFVLARASTLSL